MAGENRKWDWHWNNPFTDGASAKLRFEDDDRLITKIGKGAVNTLAGVPVEAVQGGLGSLFRAPAPKAPPAAPEQAAPPADLTQVLARTPVAKQAARSGASALQQLLAVAQGGDGGVSKVTGQLNQTLADLNKQFDARERKLNARYSNLDSENPSEVRAWQMQKADLAAEKTAALASINNAFDQGRHNNAMTESRMRAQTVKDTKAMSDLYAAAAAGAAADTSASAAMSDGGMVGGDGSDTAGVLREEQGNQAALSKATGDNISAELAALGQGLEEQRGAQSGAAARAAAWAMSQASQEHTDKVAARQQHDKDALYSALDALDAQRASTASDIAMKKVDYGFQGAQANQQFRQGVLGTALADQLKTAAAQKAASITGSTGSFLDQLRGTGVEQKLAEGQQRPTPVQSQIQTSDGLMVNSRVYSTADLAGISQSLLEGTTTADPAKARLEYTQALMEMADKRPDLYDAMVKAGYGPSLFALTSSPWSSK